ncbi:MAG: hypothetical protein GXP40_08845 [Chloroflexi bacterium]|nr:hypothetical protein [Chloroflexota bacterium]
MTDFIFTTFEEGEEMIFGPVKRIKTTSFSVGPTSMQGPGGMQPTGMQLGRQQPPPGTPEPATISRARGTVVGVTNRRVIFEDLSSSDKTRIVPNADVSRVFVRRKTRGGRTTLTIVKVQTTSGQSLKLDLGGIPEHEEARIKEAFPNAEVAPAKGLGCVATGVIVVLIGIILICVVTVLGPPIFAVLMRMFS